MTVTKQVRFGVFKTPNLKDTVHFPVQTLINLILFHTLFFTVRGPKALRALVVLLVDRAER